MVSGQCLLDHEPEKLKDKLLQGRVQGRSWKSLGDELGVSPSGARSRFEKLTGISDFKTTGKALVDGMKRGEAKTVERAVKDPLKRVEPPVKVRNSRSAVWDGFDVDATEKVLFDRGRAIVDAILDVPSMGDRVRFGTLREAKGRGGVYGSMNNSHSILIAHGEGRGTLFVHEFGHFIDDRLIGVPGEFASRRVIAGTPGMKDLMSEIGRSPTIQKIVARRESDTKTYLLAPEEQFARAFNQYIVSKVAKNPALAAGDEKLRSWVLHQQLANKSMAAGNYQWPASEFGPISDAFDALFKGLGWLR